MKRTKRTSVARRAGGHADVDVAVGCKVGVDFEAHHAAFAARDHVAGRDGERLGVHAIDVHVEPARPLGHQHRAVGKPCDVPRLVETGDERGHFEVGDVPRAESARAAAPAPHRRYRPPACAAACFDSPHAPKRTRTDQKDSKPHDDNFACVPARIQAEGKRR